MALSAVDVLALIASVYLAHAFLNRKAVPTPPGPPGLPWPIGNALQIPANKQWLLFDRWSKQHGDVVHVNLLGQPTLILGSFEAAADLLEARGMVYSDRPPAVMAGELVGWARGLGYSRGPSDYRFREFRRLFHAAIGPSALRTPEMRALQARENRKMLANILRDPEQFLDHIREATASLILQLAYGYSVTSDSDPMVRIAEDAMHGFALASEPGRYWVDHIPFLKYVPSWIPGAGFQREARDMRAALERLYDVPFDFVKREREQHSARPSMISSYLEEKGAPTPEEEEIIKAAAASLYSGGAETTPSALAAFILAMVLYPEVQARAQQELDEVLGPQLRLPTLEDEPDLPYIQALVKEIYRWNPSVPLGLAHRTTRDDVYRGWHILRGTVVWANGWTMLHDSEKFPDPKVFRPERFLESASESGADGGRVKLRTLARDEDPAQIAFGFGRRICPGMHLAEGSVFLGIATLLYTFRFGKAKDANGNELTPLVDFDGFISQPKPFKCEIQPRRTIDLSQFTDVQDV